MNNVAIKKMRSEFITTLAAQLAGKGQVWTGRAAYSPGIRSRLIFLDGNGLLFALTTEGYQGYTDSLVRVRINENWDLPTRFTRERFARGKTGPDGSYTPCSMVPEIVWERGCPRLELTLRDLDLLDLVPYAVGMFAGQITEERNYVWDQRAVDTLPPDCQSRFAFRRFVLDLTKVITREGGLK